MAVVIGSLPHERANDIAVHGAQAPWRASRGPGHSSPLHRCMASAAPKGERLLLCGLSLPPGLKAGFALSATVVIDIIIEVQKLLRASSGHGAARGALDASRQHMQGGKVQPVLAVPLLLGR